MPHIVLEHSSNLSPSSELLSELVETLAGIETFQIEHIKARAIGFDLAQVADGKAGGDFMHGTLRLLDGRSSEIRRLAGEKLFGILKREFSKEVAVSLEVREMDGGSYFK